MTVSARFRMLLLPEINNTHLATDCYVDGCHTTTHEYVCKDSDAVEGDTDDDEVVLYPRLKNLCL